MATKYISQGSAGEIQYDTGNLQLLAAPGAGKCYKITGFSVNYTYNSCNAYFQNTGGTNNYNLVSGSVTTSIGEFGYNYPSGSGNRPSISWTGTMICPVNTALNYNVTRNSSATSGIRNQYYIYLTYETCTAVGAPTEVTLARSGSGKLKLSWSGASNGTGNPIYQYEYFLTSKKGDLSTITHNPDPFPANSETSGSYEFTVSDGKTYYGLVRTVGVLALHSVYVASDGKSAAFAPKKPTSVTIARDGENKLKVSWSGAAAGTNNAITGYYIRLSTTSGGSAAAGATVSSTSTSGSYTFTVNDATAYYAAVRTNGSVYNSGLTWSSSSLGAATKCTAPTSVTIARNGDGKLKITWSGAGSGNNNAISGYDVVLATTSGGTTAFSASVSSTATGTSTTITTNNGTAYFAGVKTKGGAGSSYYSNYKWSSDKLAAATSCTAPTTVTLAQDGNGKLKVTWSGAGGGTNNAISSYYVYLSTSSGGSAASGLTTTVTTTETSGSYSFTVNNTTTYYAAVRTQGAAGSGFYGGPKWSGAKAAYYYTKCGSPGSVSLSRIRGVVTITWTAGSAGTNNSISNYGVIRNTSASTTNATSINTAASSGITNSPGAGDFYYGVRTQGSAGSSYYSDYKWSGKVTVPSKPSVTAGTVITDTQMDNLRVWINTSGITDIADATKVLASEGNTYKSGLTAGTTKIEASWYNSAADG